MTTEATKSLSLILIIDDEPTNVNFLAEALKPIGNIRVTKTSDQALNLLASSIIHEVNLVK